MKKMIAALIFICVLSSCGYDGQPGEYIDPERSYGHAEGNAGWSGNMNANGFLPEDSSKMMKNLPDSGMGKQDTSQNRNE